MEMTVKWLRHQIAKLPDEMPILVQIGSQRMAGDSLELNRDGGLEKLIIGAAPAILFDEEDCDECNGTVNNHDKGCRFYLIHHNQQG